MHGILINPSTRTIESAVYDGDYRSIYKLIGADCFTTLQLTEGETLFLDDEGLLKPNPGPFFSWLGYPQPLAGCGLILGLTPDGESISTKLTLDEVTRCVTWPSVKFEGFTDSSGYEDHPLLGRAFTLRRVTNFSPLEPKE